MIENDMNKSIEISKYLSPINDVAFKKVFMDFIKLKSFLNAMLIHSLGGEQVTEIEFIPPEVLRGNSTADAQNIFHFKCKDQAGNDFIVQMQNRIRPGLLKRVQFFAAKSLSSQLEQHKPLLPVIVLVISQRILFPEKVKCISYHAVTNKENNEHILKGLAFLFIELGKFKKSESELKTTEDYWLYFLSNAQNTSEPPHSINELVLGAYDAIKASNCSDSELEEYNKAKQLEASEELEINKAT